MHNGKKMKTELSPEFQHTAAGKLAEGILRNCVHCGFCNAACPTYQLLGDELDGPRGRIYQMKQLFEGEASAAMRTHLDRCLLCRACEPACPSGVNYGALLETSRAVLDEKFPRAVGARVARKLVSAFFVRGKLFSASLTVARRIRALLPRNLATKIPPAPTTLLTRPSPTNHPRQMLALDGCVQSSLAPNTNRAAAIILDRLGISLIEIANAKCCGGVQLHTAGESDAKRTARALIDSWLPHLDGVEAIVMTASGCGMTVKDYPRLFADESAYLAAAKKISAMSLDLCEVITRETVTGAPIKTRAPKKIAFHAPCTLQHGQQIHGNIETLLQRAGHTLCEVRDAHLCCGSAGTYALLQPKISAQLRRAKQTALTAGAPEIICTANVGCQLQLAQGINSPVVHWIEMLL